MIGPERHLAFKYTVASRFPVAHDLSVLTFPHAFFCELDAYQWLLVTGWHERRHTKKIERIQASPGFPR